MSAHCDDCGHDMGWRGTDLVCGHCELRAELDGVRQALADARQTIADNDRLFAEVRRDRDIFREAVNTYGRAADHALSELAKVKQAAQALISEYEPWCEWCRQPLNAHTQPGCPWEALQTALAEVSDGQDGEEAA